MTIGTIGIIVGVVLLLFIKMFLKNDEHLDQKQGVQGIDHDELFKEDLEFDPSWSVLSSNTHHSTEE